MSCRRGSEVLCFTQWMLGFQVWMLTGDKLETATCTAKNAHLVTRTQDIHIFRLVSNTTCPSQHLLRTPNSGTGGRLRSQLCSSSRLRLFVFFQPSVLSPLVYQRADCPGCLCSLCPLFVPLLSAQHSSPSLTPCFPAGDKSWGGPPGAERLPPEARLRAGHFWWLAGGRAARCPSSSLCFTSVKERLWDKRQWCFWSL